MEYNKIYMSVSSTRPMSSLAIMTFIAKAGHDTNYWDRSRIAGTHCSCGNGKGHFVLDKMDSKANKEGGKLYMQCRVCNEYSHL